MRALQAIFCTGQFCTMGLIRRRRRDCHFDDTPCLSLLKHLLEVQGGCHRNDGALVDGPGLILMLTYYFGGDKEEGEITMFAMSYANLGKVSHGLQLQSLWLVHTAAVS